MNWRMPFFPRMMGNTHLHSWMKLQEDFNKEHLVHTLRLEQRIAALEARANRPGLLKDPV